MSEWIDVKERLPRWDIVVHVRSSCFNEIANAVYKGHGDWRGARSGWVIPCVTEWREYRSNVCTGDGNDDDGWVSVKERLPVENKVVLVCGMRDGEETVVASFYGNEWHPYWDTSLSLISKPPTHWQLLPSPPKDKGPFHVSPRGGGCYLGVYYRNHHDSVFICSAEDAVKGRAICDRLNKLRGDRKDGR